MMEPSNVAQLAEVAKNGSPLLLQAVGRVFGIGPSERQALGATGFGVPTWTWLLLGLGAGIVAGVRLQKSYSKYIPKLVSGE